MKKTMRMLSSLLLSILMIGANINPIVLATGTEEPSTVQSTNEGDSQKGETEKEEQKETQEPEKDESSEEKKADETPAAEDDTKQKEEQSKESQESADPVPSSSPESGKETVPGKSDRKETGKDQKKEGTPENTPVAEQEVKTEEQTKGETPAFSSDVTVDDVIITVEAEAGAFPEGVKLEAEKVSVNLEKVSEAIDEVRDEKANVAISYTFDIRIVDQDGKEIQPAEGKKVTVRFKSAIIADPNLSTDVYHIEETSDNLKAEQLDSQDNGSVTEAVTDGFSYYTVEFTYESKQYVLNGDESVSLNTILDAVGLTGEVSAASVSNTELLSLSNETGEWMIKANQAFSTPEQLTVTINDIEYVIEVTDSQTEEVSEDEAVEKACIIDGDTRTTYSWYKALEHWTDGTTLQLLEDVYLGTLIEVNQNGSTFTLDLNGHNITHCINEEVISINASKTLIIIDSSEEPDGEIGHAQPDDYSPGIVNHGTLFLRSGIISDNYGSIEIEGCGVKNYGTFFMEGGEISSNNSKKGGSGVHNLDGAQFVMSGGTITSNHDSSELGGAVLLDGSSTMKISGNPVINDNIADGSKNNVYLRNGQFITITGQLDSAARIGVTMENPAILTSGFNGNAEISNFTSDDPSKSFAVRGSEICIGTTRQIAIGQSEHGSVTVAGSKSTAIADERIELSVTPEAGYELATLTYTPVGGNPVAIDKYSTTFSMPDADVTINATFKNVKYNLRVKDRQVTWDNKNDVLGDGKVRFDPETKTLTLDNANIDTGYFANDGISVSNMDLTVKGSGTISARINNTCGIRLTSNSSVPYKLTLDGNFTFIGHDSGIRVISNNDYGGAAGSLEITEGSTITAKGNNQGIYAKSGITINGNTVTAQAGSGKDAIYTDGQITIPDTHIIANPVRGKISNDGHYVVDANNNRVAYAEIKKVPSYTVTVNTAEHGTVTANKTVAKQDEQITLTVTPNDGYRLKSLTYTPEGKDAVDISSTESFYMPANNVTVNAEFMKPVASITTTEEKTTYYDTLNDALKYWRSGATLKLLDNVTASSKIEIAPSRGDVTLDLNDHTLTANHNNAVLSVRAVTLTIKNSGYRETGTITHGQGYYGAGVLVVHSDQSKLIMEGGNIRGNGDINHQGGGVRNEGTFIMKGGTISGNTSSQHGAGVFLAPEAVMNLSGNPIIENNTSGAGDDNVYISKDNIIHIIDNGLNSSAKIHINMETPGEFTEGLNNRGSILNFFSDNDKYDVSWNESRTEAILALKGQYTISFSQDISHGTVKTNNDVTSANEGETITLIENPEFGYLLNELSYTDVRGKKTAIDKGSMSFIMPASNITINADFVKPAAHITDSEGRPIHTFASIDEAASMTNWTEGTTLQLLRDVESQKIISVENTGDYKLDLAGHTLRAMHEGAVIQSAINGVTLVITDSSEARNGVITHGLIDEKMPYEGPGIMNHAESVLILENGAIRDNVTNGNIGGGVYNGGTFRMNGGSITNNYHSEPGGGVANIGDKAFFFMHGGTITDNHTGKDIGGGVYVDNTAYLILSGDPTITGNTDDDLRPDNVYLTNHKITIDAMEGLKSTAKIGVSMSQPGEFTQGLQGKGDISNFFSDSMDYYVAWNESKSEAVLVSSGDYSITIAQGIVGGTITSDKTRADGGDWVTVTAEPVSEYVLGTITYTDAEGKPVQVDLDTKQFQMPYCDTTVSATFEPKEHKHDDVTFIQWTDNLAKEQYGDSSVSASTHLPKDAGNYYLVKDVYLTSTWNVPGNTSLCLNGYDVIFHNTRNAVIRVNSDSTLNLYDHEENLGRITHESSSDSMNRGRGIELSGNATFNMYGGNITDNKETHATIPEGLGSGVYVGSGAHFNMYNGKITANNNYSLSGGGVAVDEGGSFTMSNGEISGNSANSYGGGVYSRGDAAINGGKITGNTSNIHVAGVYISSKGSLSMQGNPTVADNKTGSNQSNVYLDNGETISITGALSNETPIGISMAVPGVFTSELNGKGTIYNFTSDNQNFRVSEQNSEAALIGLYEVNVAEDITHGDIVCDKPKAWTGDTVLLTINPAPEYLLDTLTVTAGTTVIETTAVDEAHYSFTMPAQNVTVTATFKDAPAMAPEITNQPSHSGHEIYGVDAQTRILSVSVSQKDSGTLSYQWYSNSSPSSEDGTKITGATDASYTIPVKDNAGTYYYYCVVTNTKGETTATAVSQVAEVIIDPKPVTVSGIKAENKDYNGYKNATLNFTGVIINGLLDGDILSVNAVGEFTDKNVAQEKTVSISELTLYGESKDNYVLSTEGQQTTATAGINPREAYLSWRNLTFKYDGQAHKPVVSVANNVRGDQVLISDSDIEGAQTAAGTHTATAKALSGADAQNYVLPSQNTKQYTIQKAGITISADNKSSKQNEPLVSLTYTVSGDYVSGDNLGVELSTTASSSTSGVYGITVSWNNNQNYVANLVNGTYTITEAAMQVSAKDYSGIYDGNPHSITVVVSPTGAGDVYYSYTELNGENYTTGSTSPITKTDACETTTVYYYVAPKNTSSQSGVSGHKTITINKAPITPGVTISDWNYGDQKPDPVVSGNQGSGSETVKYKAITADDSTYTTEKPSQAGSYTVKADIGESTNYLAGTATHDFTIASRTAQLQWSNTSFTYDGLTHIPSASLSNLIDGDNCDVTVKGSAINAGTYTAEAIGLSNQNYSLPETRTAEFTIAKATITPTVSIEGWKYGEAAKVPTVTGNTGSGTINYFYKVKGASDESYSENAPTDAGEYTIKAEITPTVNYESGSDTADFTIDKASIQPTVSIDDWTYKESAKTPTVSGNDGGGQVTYFYKVSSASDDTYTTSIPTDAGNYTVKAVISETANYQGASAYDDFTIAKAKITPEPTVSITGWKYGEEANKPIVSGIPEGALITYSYKQKNAEDSQYSSLVPTEIGEYIVRAFIDETSNYQSAVVTTNFAIVKADISPTVSLTGWVYGQAPNTPIVSGNPGEGNVTIKYKVQGADDSSYDETVPSYTGNYTVRAEIAETANYNGAVATTNFAIVKADISPTVSLTDWVYGQAPNTPIVSGNPGEGNVTIKYKVQGADDSSYNKTVPSYAGNYTVRAEIAETDNYNSAVATNDFTIKKAVPVINDNQKPKGAEGLEADGTDHALVIAPGAEPPTGYTLQYSMDGESWQTEIPTGKEAGSYTVHVKFKSSDNNYADVEFDIVVPITKVAYSVKKGNGLTWTKGSTSTADFEFIRSVESGNRTAFDFFRKVQVDGKDVDAANYVKERGSVIIRLKPAYLETLSIGGHTITAVFAETVPDRGEVTAEAAASFTVKEKPTGGDSSKPSKPVDNVVTCQMAGYPSNYVWNEAAKACQAGYLDAGGNFHPYRTASPNTYDPNSIIFAYLAMIAITIACFCGVKLLHEDWEV